MIFRRNNNSRKAEAGQQPGKGKKLTPVIVTYWHRLDEQGLPLVKVTFVQSTAEPKFRYSNFFNWCMRIHIERMPQCSISTLIMLIRKGGK